MKQRRTITVLIVLLAAALLAYFVFFGSNERKFQWYESYDPQSDQPYGTAFIRKMLEQYRPGGNFTFNKNKPVYELLDSTKNLTGIDYVLIGPSPYLDHHDVNALTKFIQRGNDVFIASQDPPTELIAALYQNVCDVQVAYFSNQIEEIAMNFYHYSLRAEKPYRFRYRFAGIDRPYHWSYLDEEIFCDSTETLEPLGHQGGDLVNFFRIGSGKGNLYLHTNPIVFTNYFMVQKDKLGYATAIFSHLQGTDIIWDEFSKLPFSQDRNEYNSPLYFILEQPSLKYAWWMMLLTVVIFVFFTARRKQRAIPVQEIKSNTSLEFVRMISSLHFQNGNHLDMAKKKMKYFLYFIRTRYGIHTAHFTQPFVPLVAEKARVPLALVQHVHDRWNVIAAFGYSSIEEQRLVDLYTAIEAFYKECK